MAEYQELRNKVVVESDTSGLDDVKKGIEETKDAAEGLNKAFEDTNETIESTSKAARTFQKLGDVIGSSRESLLRMIVDARKGKIEQMFGNDKFTDADFAKQGLIYLREQSQLQKEIDKQNAQAKLPQEQISRDQIEEIAKQTSKLDLLKMKLVDAENEYKRLFDAGIQGKRLTSALEAVMRAQTKYNEALEESNRIAEEAKHKNLFEGQSAWDEVSSRFGEGFGFNSILGADAMGNANFATAIITRLGDALEFAGKAAKTAGSGVAKFISAIGQREVGKVNKFVSGLGNIVNSFKRIAFYRFIRSVIRSITDGFKEGVNNLYQWSKLLGGEFAKSMDTIATSSLYMKNSLGAMVAPLINALAPAVDYLIDKFVALLNVINQVLALFTGAATWTKAKKYPTQYADAVSSGAGKAADALHKLGLAQIDELTILDKNHGDNGSGGGGGSGLDYGSMFETEKLGGGIWDKIKEAIDKGDWRGAGKILAERLNEIVDSLDTHKWGQELGKKLDNGIQLAYGFMKFTNFKNIGKKIAEFINGSMEMIDWETAGRLAVRNVTALLDTIIGILGGLDWGLVATSIKDYLVGKMNEIGDWFDSVEWDKVGTNLYNNVKKFIENINFDELARTFFYNLGKAFGHIAVAVGAFFNGAFEDVKKYFADKTEEAGGDSFKGFLKGIGDGVKSIGQWIKTNVIDPFVKGWKEALGIQSPSTVMAAIGKDTIDGFFKGITDVINGVRQWVQTKVIDPVVNAFKGALGIQSPSTVMASVGKDTIDGFLKGIRDGINNIGNWIKTNIINPVVNGFKNALGIHSPSTVMNDIGKDTIAGFRNGLVNAWTSITSWVKQKITDLKNAFKFEWKLPDIKLPHIPTPHFHMGTGVMGIQYPVFDGWWAQGGFPTEGSLFIAREPGNPEMVGSIGGHTAVANNDQIVEAVSQGVYEAVREAMGSGNQSVNVYLDGKQISGTVVQNINSETRRTGNSPLLSY